MLESFSKVQVLCLTVTAFIVGTSWNHNLKTKISSFRYYNEIKDDNSPYNIYTTIH